MKNDYRKANAAERKAAIEEKNRKDAYKFLVRNDIRKLKAALQEDIRVKIELGIKRKFRFLTLYQVYQFHKKLGQAMKDKEAEIAHQAF